MCQLISLAIEIKKKKKSRAGVVKSYSLLFLHSGAEILKNVHQHILEK
jgi:hypothetical protein